MSDCLCLVVVMKNQTGSAMKGPYVLSLASLWTFAQQHPYGVVWLQTCWAAGAGGCSALSVEQDDTVQGETEQSG